MEKYDVIVVGSGVGGLSAATYLAKHHKKVLVLEKHNLPGGCATSFVRGDFEFEATLHEFCQMGEGEYEGALRKLVNDYGLRVEWVSVNETFNSICTDAGDKGFRVSMPVGVENFINEMEKAVPGSKASVTTLMEFGRMLSDGVAWLGKRNNEPGPLSKVALLLKWSDLMKVVPVPCDTMLRKIGMPDKARQIVESYWTYVCADSTHMSFAVYAFMLYTYITQKPWFAKNRSHELVMAFDEAIRKNGGDIWYNTEVKKINIEKGAVSGVTLSDDTFIPCKRVISNLMPTVVYDRMIDHNCVPEYSRRSCNARKLGLQCFTIYLALNKSAEEIGIKGYDTFIRTNPENSEQYKSWAKLETHEGTTSTCLNNANPDASRPGTCFLQLSEFYSENCFEHITPENYFKFKEEIAEKEIAAYEKVMGVTIKPYIEEIVIASPMTWGRYLGTPYGDIYGYEPRDWDGMFDRVQCGHKIDYTIKGLRFAGGHGTQMDGYSQAIASGKEQARYTLLDMRGGK